jgi:hypothetical protein
MPFVILGKEYLNLNIKPDMIEKLLGTWETVDVDEYNRRNYIYKHIKLVNNIHIDGKKVRNFENFENFLTTAMK